MAPVIAELKSDNRFRCLVCVTAQHRQMLDQVLEVFNIEPDFDLNIMSHDQSLTKTFSRIVTSVSGVIERTQPDIVLVHGDTITTSGSALASLFHQVKVGHVEAGLRTGNLYSPWPEEANRRVVSALANFHFAPTKHASANLVKEGVAAENIVVTGNTVVDALLEVVGQLQNDEPTAVKLRRKFAYLDTSKKLILVTGHRRENFGEGFNNICGAIAHLAKVHADVQVVYPVHLNPNVQQPVNRVLGGLGNVFLIDPLDYLSFVFLMNRSFLILTDSGGIQEEAPSLGKPILLMRDTTERPEALEAGTVRLVGTERIKIIRETEILLSDAAEYERMSNAYNPYGDGNASKRITEFLASRV